MTEPVSLTAVRRTQAERLVAVESRVEHLDARHAELHGAITALGQDLGSRIDRLGGRMEDAELGRARAEGRAQGIKESRSVRRAWMLAMVPVVVSTLLYLVGGWVISDVLPHPLAAAHAAR